MKLPETLSTSEQLQACYEYIDTVNSNIDLFLRDKTNKMSIDLENIDVDFPKFWKFIKAEGKLDLALTEFSIKHNASRRKVKYRLFHRLKSIIHKEWKFLVLFLNYNKKLSNMN